MPFLILMIRKTLSVVFALLILFNISGYWFVFQYDQVTIRTAMKAMIRNGSYRGFDQEITVLNPPGNPDFRQIDKGEFLYRGKLYDIISSRVSGTSIVFRCINDTKEEQLQARCDRFSSTIAGMNIPERSRTGNALLHHIIKHALTERYTLQPPLAAASIRFANPSQLVTALPIVPSLPPPKSA